MKTILTGNHVDNYIDDNELLIIVSWLDRWGFVDSEERQHLIMAYSNEEILEGLEQLRKTGNVLSWHGIKLVHYPDVPEDAFLVIVAEMDGEPSACVLWQCGISEDEARRRIDNSGMMTIGRVNKQSAPSVSRLMMRTMIAECVLPEIDS